MGHLYPENGVLTYAVEVGPMVRPADLPTRLREHGFVAFKKTGMLYRRAEPIDEPSCDLRVRRAERDEAKIFANLCCRVFGFDEPFLGMLSATFESSDWQQWLAFDGRSESWCDHAHGRWHRVGWLGRNPGVASRARCANGALGGAIARCTREARAMGHIGGCRGKGGASRLPELSSPWLDALTTGSFTFEIPESVDRVQR